MLQVMYAKNTAPTVLIFLLSAHLIIWECVKTFVSCVYVLGQLFLYVLSCIRTLVKDTRGTVYKYAPSKIIIANASLTYSEVGLYAHFLEVHILRKYKLLSCYGSLYFEILSALSGFNLQNEKNNNLAKHSASSAVLSVFSFNDSCNQQPVLCSGSPQTTTVPVTPLRPWLMNGGRQQVGLNGIQWLMMPFIGSTCPTCWQLFFSIAWWTFWPNVKC